MYIRYILFGKFQHFKKILHSQDPQKMLNSDIENLIKKIFAKHHDIVITTSIIYL